MNLIPESIPHTGNYWCTWDTQWNMLKESLPDGAPIPTRDRMDEDYLFGEDGVLKNYFHPVRKDLTVILDDGWDVPYGAAEQTLFGSLCADTERFPSLSGSPAEMLAELNRRILALGYAGTGLWVPAQINGIPEDDRAAWCERARWCHEAGIRYWKVDWGKHCDDPAYRQMITACAREHAPGLLVEHALCQGPFVPQTADELPARAAYLRSILPVSDFIRTYDVSPEFKYTTTLLRTAELLQIARDVQGPCAIINVEDTDIIGAALGCSLGVMRHEKETGWQKLTYPPRPIAESVRALRWQRMAPPFAANAVPVFISGETLTDSWYYPLRDKTLWPNTCDETVTQSVPALICRNMAPPVIESDGEKPFIACSLHPETGALSVAAIPRTLPGRLYTTPPVSLTVAGGSTDAPIGVFGHFSRLTIRFDDSVEGKRLFAQDLTADEALDITDQVRLNGSELQIPGSLIEELCPDPDALPGIVFRFLP